MRQVRYQGRLVEQMRERIAARKRLRKWRARKRLREAIKTTFIRQYERDFFAAFR